MTSITRWTRTTSFIPANKNNHHHQYNQYNRGNRGNNRTGHAVASGASASIQAYLSTWSTCHAVTGNESSSVKAMVPEPALSFTIPSLHDGISLDCRVYHPASLAATKVQAGPWKKHAAVVAHPYAPMGGCYDDPVLGSITARLLGAGYLVGTFNFRYVPTF